MHPWHDVAIGSDIVSFVPSVIEIPRGSKLKYEVDKATGLLRLDRVLYSSVHYPANYGFIPRTYAGDGDPLDILVLMQEPVAPLSIVRARPLGGIRMHDNGDDDKIIAVCIDDPAYSHYQGMNQLPPHVVKELDRFFRDYKMLESQVAPVIDNAYNLPEALRVIQEARDAYERGDWKES